MKRNEDDYREYLADKTIETILSSGHKLDEDEVRKLKADLNERLSKEIAPEKLDEASEWLEALSDYMDSKSKDLDDIWGQGEKINNVLMLLGSALLSRLSTTQKINDEQLTIDQRMEMVGWIKEFTKLVWWIASNPETINKEVPVETK